MDLSTAPTFAEIATLSVIIAAATFGVVEVVKGAVQPIRARYRTKGRDHWIYQTALRALALVIGATLGAALVKSAYGWAIGLGAGGLDSVIYTAIKRRIRSKGKGNA